MHKSICACIVAMSVSFQVNAAGIPVVDAANLADNLKDYVQHLKDYEQVLLDYQNQLNQYERQIKDATRPFSDVWQDVSSVYSDAMEISGGINNLRNNYSQTMDYISRNYGDSDFWVNCAKNGCDPTGQLESAYRATTSQLGYSTAFSEQMSGLSGNSYESINELAEDLSSGSDEGTAAALQKIGLMQAEIGKISVNNQKQLAQFIAAQNALRDAELKQKQYEIEKKKLWFGGETVKEFSNTIKPSDFK